MHCLFAVESCHFSPGAEALAEAITDAGFPVVAVGPESNCAFSEGARPDVISLLADRAKGRIYCVNGSHVQNVQVAVGLGLVEGDAIVVSHVEQDGSATDTIAADQAIQAGMEAAALGYPAIAVVSARQSTSWSTLDHPLAFHHWCATAVADLAAIMAAFPPPSRSVLVVWLPDDLRHRELKISATGVSGEGGYIVVTPVDMDGSGGSADGLGIWVQAVVSKINDRLGAGGAACLAGCCG